MNATICPLPKSLPPHQLISARTDLSLVFFRWLPELQELVSQLEDKLANKEQPKRKSKTPTKVKEFNLTQPKPKEVPVPDEIPRVPRPRTVSGFVSGP